MIEKDNSEQTPQTTHFGFKTVDATQKQGLVRGVFDSVAPQYDIMNDVMSGGLHRLWKDALIRHLKPAAGMRLLDVAGGTGDIAFRFLATKDLPSQQDAPAKNVVVCDINQDMLAVGRDRGWNRGILKHIQWVCGNAEALPFPDHHFDAYSIAFGIRNVTHIDQALAEAYRVLKPGGRFLCLEFSRVDLPLLRGLYDAYSFHLLPRLGQMITGDKDSYRYLVESIRRFPDQDRFKAMLVAAGFDQVRYHNMTGGIVALHSGWKI